MSKQLECRIVIENISNNLFKLGMYDPLNGRYAELGTHPVRDKDKIVRDLAQSIERAGHLLTFCERTE